MKYVTATLTPGEEVKCDVGLDWSVKCAVAFCGALAVIVWFTASGWWHVATVPLAWFGIRGWVNILTTEMAVTSKRVVHKRGWIARRTKEMRLDAFETVQLTQGVFGRLFGCSAKVIVTGRGGESIAFSNLDSDDALDFKRALEEVAERNP